MTVHVAAEHPYDVRIEPGALQLLAEQTRGAHKVAVIHPSSLGEAAAVTVAALGNAIAIEIPDGESAKTPAVLVDCWNRLAQEGFTRSDSVVGFGGGVTTDLAGFVAASWLRGVRYVSVPTTVLAMVDAAVGGKTGINLPYGKNLVGAFYEPASVLCDLELLHGLPAAEVSSGLAEVVKAGLIADARITELIAEDPADAQDVSSARLAELIRLSIQMKAQVVTDDLRERTGAASDIGRESLNYGHTLGHAIEKHENFAMRHGEAVSIGMVFAAEVASRLGLLDRAAVELHRSQCASVGLPTSYRGASWDQLRPIIALDKKSRGSTVRLVLLEGLRHPIIVENPDEQVLADAFAALR